jgi:hypothetical protein
MRRFLALRLKYSKYPRKSASPLRIPQVNYVDL